MIKELMALIILISAFPVGYLLAYLTKEELVSGRKYFLILAFASLIASFAFAKTAVKIPAILTLFYIMIASFVSLWKSYDKKFLRQK